MDTDQRLTTEELAVLYRKSIDEAQQLGTSVMVTEKNWNAMLEMQDGLLPEWLNTMFVQIFVYSYVWAKHTVYLYPVIGSALRLLNVPAQQKPVCKDV